MWSQRVRRLLRRSPRELALLLEALAALAAADAVVTLGPYALSRRLLVRASAEPEGGLGEGERARGEAVLRAFRTVAARYARRASCLRRSLALHYMLSRRGVPAVVRIGVRGGERFEAHAWVEVGGAVFGDAAGVRDAYKVLPIGLAAVPGGLRSLR